MDVLFGRHNCECNFYLHIVLQSTYVNYRSSFGKYFAGCLETTRRLLSRDDATQEIANLILARWSKRPSLWSCTPDNFWKCPTPFSPFPNSPYAIPCERKNHMPWSYEILLHCRHCRSASRQELKKYLNRFSIAVIDYVKVGVSCNFFWHIVLKIHGRKAELNMRPMTTEAVEHPTAVEITYVFFVEGAKSFFAMKMALENILRLIIDYRLVQVVPALHDVADTAIDVYINYICMVRLRKGFELCMTRAFHLDN